MKWKPLEQRSHVIHLVCARLTPAAECKIDDRITEEAGPSEEPSAVIQVEDDGGLDQGKSGEK